jgi:hypothetical protein
MKPLTIIHAFLRGSLSFLILSGFFLAAILQRANASEPRIVNIYNFVRNSDYRLPNSEDILYEASRYC